jgi:hypothetical protein
MARQPSLEKLHRENLQKFDVLAEEVREHIRADNERFNTIDKSLGSIADDVRSLLQTRSFTKGAWKAIVTIAGATSVVIGLIIAWVKG